MDNEKGVMKNERIKPQPRRACHPGCGNHFHVIMPESTRVDNEGIYTFVSKLMNNYA